VGGAVVGMHSRPPLFGMSGPHRLFGTSVGGAIVELVAKNIIAFAITIQYDRYQRRDDVPHKIFGKFTRKASVDVLYLSCVTRDDLIVFSLNRFYKSIDRSW
jgi:hypothetical protein